MFAQKGVTATTEEIATAAEVAIGTLFRHFPTKDALLQAIMKGLKERLTADAHGLAGRDDPTEAFFAFFTRVVEQATQKRIVIDLLAVNGVDIPVTQQVMAVGDAVSMLLEGAQRAGGVWNDIELPEVMALLTAACHGAVHSGWDEHLRQRTLGVIFDGLRAGERRPLTR